MLTSLANGLSAIQGKDCLVQKFRNSSVMLEHPSFRPKVGQSLIDSILRTNCDIKVFHVGGGPLTGQEDVFPEPDNKSKMRRSVENAAQVGRACCIPFPSISLTNKRFKVYLPQELANISVTSSADDVHNLIEGHGSRRWTPRKTAARPSMSDGHWHISLIDIRSAANDYIRKQ